MIRDRNGDNPARSRAIAVVSERRDAESVGMFLSLLNDRAVYVDMAKALAAFDDPRIPKELLKHRNNLRQGSREAATDTLCSRKSYAIELVKALDAGDVASSDLTASHVRQLLAFGDDSIKHTIESKWGVINDSSAAKEAAIAVWKTKLTPDVLAKPISKTVLPFLRNPARCVTNSMAKAARSDRT